MREFTNYTIVGYIIQVIHVHVFMKSNELLCKIVGFSNQISMMKNNVFFFIIICFFQCWSAHKLHAACLGTLPSPLKFMSACKALVTMTLTNVVRTIFYHLRNGQKIVRTTFVRVIVTKPLGEVKKKHV